MFIINPFQVAGGSPPGGITFLDSISEGGTQNGVTTGAFDSTGADFLVAAISDFSATTAATFSDSLGNTWNLLTQSVGATTRSRIAWTKPSSVGAGQTFSAIGASSYPSVAVMAFSGLSATPFDAQNGATGASGTSLQTGSITPAQNGSLVVSSICLLSGSGTSINSGMTVAEDVMFINAVHFGLGFAYLIQPTAAAINPTWSWTGSSETSARIASFF